MTPRVGSVVRAISGAVAAGLVVLALVVVVAAVLSARDDGPGAGVVLAHALGAAVAVGAQVVADRHRRVSVAAAGASVLVLGVAAVLLWTQWWQ